MSVNLDNYKKILAKVQSYEAHLIAVSKTKPVEDIQELIEAGQKDFGENYVQELTEKHEVIGKNVRWHFIGHLQTNKVKPTLPIVRLVHGVDSFKLLKEIDKQSKALQIVTDCLLQIHISKEETKFGFDEAEAEALMLFPELIEMENIQIRGLMGMASLTEDHEKIKNEFKQLKSIYDNCKIMSFDPSLFNILSMGMTSDYEIALDNGSNMVRIGSAIFGEREKR